MGLWVYWFKPVFDFNPQLSYGRKLFLIKTAEEGIYFDLNKTAEEEQTLKLVCLLSPSIYNKLLHTDQTMN